MPSQTEKDTARAQGRVTRSEEFQKRVDAADKAKSGDVQGSAKPTADQTRNGQLAKNRTTDTQRDTDRAQSRITRSAEYQRRIDAAAEAVQVGTAMKDLNFITSTSTAGGGGLPPYPPENPPVTNDALLVWDDTEEEGNWATEASLEDAGEETVSILAFKDEKLHKLENYTATDGIICQSGSPVDVKILINFD